VSLAVYDPYQGMDKLAGLQLLGVAGLVADDSPERARALTLHGLDEVRLATLPFALNLIRVRVERAEFLWSGFTALGFDVRQTYLFPSAGEASGPDPSPPSEPRA
jgi:hypothetical protein